MAAGTETKERVIFIEYSDGKIFNVVTHKPFKFHDGTEAICTEFYDVEWCKRDQRYYFHNSGSGVGEALTVYGNVGGTTTYWAARDVKVVVKGEAKVRRVVQARGRKDFEKALAGNGSGTFSERRCEYCPTCDDYLPSEDTNRLCDHVWWCDDTGDWSKPGYRCDWDCEECQEEGRETKPEPPKAPWMMVAEGYGIAASRIAMIVRRILEKYERTPELLSEEMDWCGCGTNAIRKAMMGEVDKDDRYDHIYEITMALELTRDEHEELSEAFEEAWS
jgi:hypothetical protein